MQTSVERLVFLLGIKTVELDQANQRIEFLMKRIGELSDQLEAANKAEDKTLSAEEVGAKYGEPT
jgi:hypothetical protein